MKNVNCLFALTGIFYLAFLFSSCEDEAADPPIEGVTAMKQSSSNPSVWNAEIDISQLKSDFEEGMTPQLVMSSNSPLISCIQIIKDKNNCILAATGNWENAGVSDNPLGDSICCAEYYNTLLAKNGCKEIVVDDKSNILNAVTGIVREELISVDDDKKTPVNIDFSNYSKAVEKVNIGFLVHDEKHYLATSFVEKDGEGKAVQKTLMRNLNAAASETFIIPEAKFVAPNTGGGGTGSFTFGTGGGSNYQLYVSLPTEWIDTLGTVANCGGQGTDKPRIKTGKKKQLMGGNFCGNCNSVCVSYTNPISVEMFMHIGHPINQPNIYHGDSIITKIFRVNRNSINWNDFNDNSQSAIGFTSSYSAIKNDSPTSPVLIDSMLFKPYLKYDSTDMKCPDKLKIKVNRIAIPLEFALPTDFFDNPNEIILVAAQIVTPASVSIPSVLETLFSDPSQVSDHATTPPILENEILLVFSSDDTDQITIDNEDIDNIFICRTETQEK